jgi:hypothetical protein
VTANRFKIVMCPYPGTPDPEWDVPKWGGESSLPGGNKAGSTTPVWDIPLWLRCPWDGAQTNLASGYTTGLRLPTQYNIYTSNPEEITKENFKGHVEARAINYWTQQCHACGGLPVHSSRQPDPMIARTPISQERPPPRHHLGGPVHTRYMADFGIREFTPRCPKIRTYLRTQTLYPRLVDCRAAELLMHFRLETLSFHAFHVYTRHRETTAARYMRELCPSCKQHAETPTHFLLECPAYSSPRSLPHVATCIADAQNSSEQ